MSTSPHKMFLLVVCAVGGGIGLLFPDAIAPSIGRSFQAPTQLVWFAGLAITSLLALYGISRQSVRGLLWERVALASQAVLLAAYSVALVGFNGFHGVGGLLFYGGFAAANVYRVWIIAQTLRVLPPPDDEAVVRLTGD